MWFVNCNSDDVFFRKKIFCLSKINRIQVSQWKISSYNVQIRGHNFYPLDEVLIYIKTLFVVRKDNKMHKLQVRKGLAAITEINSCTLFQTHRSPQVKGNKIITKMLINELSHRLKNGLQKLDNFKEISVMLEIGWNVLTWLHKRQFFTAVLQICKLVVKHSLENLMLLNFMDMSTVLFQNIERSSL